MILGFTYCRVLENLQGSVPTQTGKWEDIFQSGKSQTILNRLEKSGKITQNTRKLGISNKCYLLLFSEIQINCILFAKMGQVSSLKIFFKNTGIMENNTEKGNFVSPEKREPCTRCTPKPQLFLGGLSLHLNHLIASHAANYDWPFGTLPFGLFGSNLDTRDLETYSRTYSGHF